MERNVHWLQRSNRAEKGSNEISFRFGGKDVLEWECIEWAFERCWDIHCWPGQLLLSNLYQNRNC